MHRDYDTINHIIRLFHKEDAIHYELKEILMRENDCRWVIYVDFPDEKFVIKVAANDFTFKERVNGWVTIINAYRDLGCYSPALRKSLNGNYCETILFHNNSCVVWEEEYAKYYFRNMLDKSAYRNKDGSFVYHNEILAFLGKAAQKHYDFFPYKSGWVRLEPFCANETTDEITECVKTFDGLVREKAPHFISRWEKIYALFEENKKRLAEIYPKLPTSVFQSDHFESNLLLSADGHFKGLIDYNLAGTDTAVNVFLYTIIYGDGNYLKRPKPDRSDMLPEYNLAVQDWMMQNILDSLRYLRRFYTFTKDEAQAILPLYKYITCIEYTQIRAFEKYYQDDHKLNLLFHVMESEFLRQEDGFYDVMLN